MKKVLIHFFIIIYTIKIIAMAFSVPSNLSNTLFYHNLINKNYIYVFYLQKLFKWILILIIQVFCYLINYQLMELYYITFIILFVQNISSNLPNTSKKKFI